MHKTRITVLTAVLLVLAASSAALAQTIGSTVARQTMFGPRVFGQPLQPKIPEYAGGFVYGPSGNFIGMQSNWALPPMSANRISPVTINPGDAYQINQAQALNAASLTQAQQLTTTPTNPALLPETAATAANQQAAAAVQSASAQVPANTTVAPVATNTQELPMRQGAAVGAVAVVPQNAAVAGTATAPGLPLPTGPQVLSPLQAPGAPYTVIRADFPYAKPASDQAGARLTAQLSRLARPQAGLPIQVSVQGQTAVLRGTVATPYDRALAEQVVRMEAGIWTVDNQLKVSSPEPAAQQAR